MCTSRKTIFHIQVVVNSVAKSGNQKKKKERFSDIKQKKKKKKKKHQINLKVQVKLSSCFASLAYTPKTRTLMLFLLFCD
jgi:hypothetical protein